MILLKTHCSRLPSGLWRLGVVMMSLVATMALIGGCARPSSSDWAQTSKVMIASDTTNTQINLGVRD